MHRIWISDKFRDNNKQVFDILKDWRDVINYVNKEKARK